MIAIEDKRKKAPFYVHCILNQKAYGFQGVLYEITLAQPCIMLNVMPYCICSVYKHNIV